MVVMTFFKAQKAPPRLHAAISAYFSGICSRLPEDVEGAGPLIMDAANKGRYNRAHALSIKYHVCPPKYSQFALFPIEKFRTHIDEKIDKITANEQLASEKSWRKSLRRSDDYTIRPSYFQKAAAKTTKKIPNLYGLIPQGPDAEGFSPKAKKTRAIQELESILESKFQEGAEKQKQLLEGIRTKLEGADAEDVERILKDEELNIAEGIGGIVSGDVINLSSGIKSWYQPFAQIKGERDRAKRSAESSAVGADLSNLPTNDTEDLQPLSTEEEEEKANQDSNDGILPLAVSTKRFHVRGTSGHDKNDKITSKIYNTGLYDRTRWGASRGSFLSSVRQFKRDMKDAGVRDLKTLGPAGERFEELYKKEVARIKDAEKALTTFAESAPNDTEGLDAMRHNLFKDPKYVRDRLEMRRLFGEIRHAATTPRPNQTQEQSVGLKYLTTRYRKVARAIFDADLKLAELRSSGDGNDPDTPEIKKILDTRRRSQAEMQWIAARRANLAGGKIGSKTIRGALPTEAQLAADVEAKRSVPISTESKPALTESKPAGLVRDRPPVTLPPEMGLMVKEARRQLAIADAVLPGLNSRIASLEEEIRTNPGNVEPLSAQLAEARQLQAEVSLTRNIADTRLKNAEESRIAIGKMTVRPVRPITGGIMPKGYEKGDEAEPLSRKAVRHITSKTFGNLADYMTHRREFARTYFGKDSREYAQEMEQLRKMVNLIEDWSDRFNQGTIPEFEEKIPASLAGDVHKYLTTHEWEIPRFGSSETKSFGTAEGLLDHAREAQQQARREYGATSQKHQLAAERYRIIRNSQKTLAQFLGANSDTSEATDDDWEKFVTGKTRQIRGVVSDKQAAGLTIGQLEKIVDERERFARRFFGENSDTYTNEKTEANTLFDDIDELLEKEQALSIRDNKGVVKPATDEVWGKYTGTQISQSMAPYVTHFFNSRSWQIPDMDHALNQSLLKDYIGSTAKGASMAPSAEEMTKKTGLQKLRWEMAQLLVAGDTKSSTEGERRGAVVGKDWQELEADYLRMKGKRPRISEKTEKKITEELKKQIEEERRNLDSRIRELLKDPNSEKERQYLARRLIFLKSGFATPQQKLQALKEAQQAYGSFAGSSVKMAGIEKTLRETSPQAYFQKLARHIDTFAAKSHEQARSGDGAASSALSTVMRTIADQLLADPRVGGELRKALIDNDLSEAIRVAARTGNFELAHLLAKSLDRSLKNKKYNIDMFGGLEDDPSGTQLKTLFSAVNSAATFPANKFQTPEATRAAFFREGIVRPAASVDTKQFLPQQELLDVTFRDNPTGAMRLEQIEAMQQKIGEHDARIKALKDRIENLQNPDVEIRARPYRLEQAKGALAMAEDRKALAQTELERLMATPATTRVSRRRGGDRSREFIQSQATAMDYYNKFSDGGNIGASKGWLHDYNIALHNNDYDTCHNMLLGQYYGQISKSLAEDAEATADPKAKEQVQSAIDNLRTATSSEEKSGSDWETARKIVDNLPMDAGFLGNTADTIKQFEVPLMTNPDGSEIRTSEPLKYAKYRPSLYVDHKPKQVSESASLLPAQDSGGSPLDYFGSRAPAIASAPYTKVGEEILDFFSLPGHIKDLADKIEDAYRRKWHERLKQIVKQVTAPSPNAEEMVPASWGKMQEVLNMFEYYNNDLIKPGSTPPITPIELASLRRQRITEKTNDEDGGSFVLTAAQVHDFIRDHGSDEMKELLYDIYGSGKTGILGFEDPEKFKRALEVFKDKLREKKQTGTGAEAYVMQNLGGDREDLESRCDKLIKRINENLMDQKRIAQNDIIPPVLWDRLGRRIAEIAARNSKKTASADEVAQWRAQKNHDLLHAPDGLLAQVTPTIPVDAEKSIVRLQQAQERVRTSTQKQYEHAVNLINSIPDEDFEKLTQTASNLTEGFSDELDTSVYGMGKDPKKFGKRVLDGSLSKEKHNASHIAMGKVLEEIRPLYEKYIQPHEPLFGSTAKDQGSTWRGSTVFAEHNPAVATPDGKPAGLSGQLRGIYDKFFAIAKSEKPAEHKAQDVFETFRDGHGVLSLVPGAPMHHSLVGHQYLPGYLFGQDGIQKLSSGELHPAIRKILANYNQQIMQQKRTPMHELRETAIARHGFTPEELDAADEHMRSRGQATISTVQPKAPKTTTTTGSDAPVTGTLGASTPSGGSEWDQWHNAFKAQTAKTASETGNEDHHAVAKFHLDRWSPLISTGESIASLAPVAENKVTPKVFGETINKVKNGLMKIAEGNYDLGHDTLKAVATGTNTKKWVPKIIAPPPAEAANHFDVMPWKDGVHKKAILSAMPKEPRADMPSPPEAPESTEKSFSELVPHQSFIPVPFPFKLGWFR